MTPERLQVDRIIIPHKCQTCGRKYRDQAVRVSKDSPPNTMQQELSRRNAVFCAGHNPKCGKPYVRFKS